MKILRIIQKCAPTSAPYYQHSLPFAKRHEVTILTLHTAAMPVDPTINLLSAGGSYRTFVRELDTLLDRQHFDVIHVHSVPLGFVYCCRSVLGGRNSMSRSVLTIHNSFKVFTLINRLLLTLQFPMFRCVICCSRASYESLPSFLHRYGGARLSYVTNGLDLKRVDQVAASHPGRNRNGQPFEVVCVATFKPVKNQLTVLRGFSRLDEPDAVLRFVGAGQTLVDIQQEARRLGCAERVVFTGMQSRDQALAWMLAADVFISASTGEGLPVAVIEAMACRCLPILSDIPPHREIVGDLEGVPLLDPFDVEGFRLQLERMIRLSAEEKGRLRQAVRRRVEERYSLDQMLAGYEAIYRTISDEVG